MQRVLRRQEALSNFLLQAGRRVSDQQLQDVEYLRKSVFLQRAIPLPSGLRVPVVKLVLEYAKKSINSSFFDAHLVGVHQKVKGSKLYQTVLEPWDRYVWFCSEVCEDVPVQHGVCYRAPVVEAERVPKLPELAQSVHVLRIHPQFAHHSLETGWGQ